VATNTPDELYDEFWHLYDALVVTPVFAGAFIVCQEDIEYLFPEDLEQEDLDDLVAFSAKWIATEGQDFYRKWKEAILEYAKS
jgi:hypothetical protein